MHTQSCKLWVPHSFRADTCSYYHLYPHARHPGVEETLCEVNQRYTWDGASRDAEAYVQQWQICATTKAHGAYALWTSHDVPHEHGHKLSST
ncbi:hypothetical protein PR048_006714 [Dryococelus australis]|uniref:Integrase zinc-binding domain-containing protein n=1 Tax=Dryococelus australis TaxID=614101 RepID=A0ABQ9IBQ7_9NEOP|nr:hypothetical protein PR048_006714 [Dryococelus australis]